MIEDGKEGETEGDQPGKGGPMARESHVKESRAGMRICLLLSSAIMW